MTKVRLLLFAAAFGLTSVQLLAQEQPETGTRLAAPKSRNVGSVAMTAKDQALGAKRMAQCLYNKKTVLARQTLLAPTKAAADAATNKLMGTVQCSDLLFSNELVEERHVMYPTDILRGMLAEEALSRVRTQVGALQPLPLQQIYDRNWYAVTGRHISVDEMGACVADTNPSGVMSLTRTQPTSAEENAAFGSLMQSFGKCLRAGVKLQASRPALRAALAEALFQRVNAPTPAAVTTTAEVGKN